MYSGEEIRPCSFSKLAILKYVTRQLLCLIFVDKFLSFSFKKVFSILLFKFLADFGFLFSSRVADTKKKEGEKKLKIPSTREIKKGKHNQHTQNVSTISFV